MESPEQMTQETYRLTRDNNRMLRAMRRNAFIGAILKIVFWAALILAPLWFYAHYLAPVVAGLQRDVGALQRSGSGTSQFSALQDLLRQLQAAMPSIPSASGSSTPQ